MLIHKAQVGNREIQKLCFASFEWDACFVDGVKNIIHDVYLILN